MPAPMPVPTMSTPKPCVFCGCDDVLGTIDGAARFVACRGCGASGPRIVANDNATAHAKWTRAIDAWNREVHT